MRKTNLALIFITCLSIIGFKAKTNKDGLLSDTKMAHVGIVVSDIDITIEKWSELLGTEKIPTISIAAGHQDNPSHFDNQLTDVKAKLAFFNLENLQIELIQPIGEADSHWKEHLRKHGNSVHHFGFQVKGLGEIYTEKFETAGMLERQRGGWDGGEYAYMEGMEQLGVMIELLESYN